MKVFYEESWFKKLGILICVLLLLLSFGIRNLLIFTLPFILIGLYGLISPEGDKEHRLFVRIGSVFLMLPFLLAAVALFGGGLKGVWFDDYSRTVWAIVFNGFMIYTGAVVLAGILLWIFKGQYRKNAKESMNPDRLSFVTLDPRQPESVKNLLRPEPGATAKAIVVPINKKTEWVKIPCRLTNESTLPVISMGLEALNDEITGTRSMEHSLLIPPHKTVGIHLYVPVTKARHVEIRLSFTNVIGETTLGLLSLTASEGLYYGEYNLNKLQLDENRS